MAKTASNPTLRSEAVPSQDSLTLAFPGMPGQAPDVWDRIYDRSMRFLGLDQPKIVQQNWTPGLARRNRERREEAMNNNFRRD